MKKITLAKMQRRNRTGKRTPAPFRWLGWLAALILIGGGVLVLLAPSLVTGYLRAYLQKDEFRHQAEAMIGATIGGKAHLAPLIWNDDTVTLTDLSLETASGWSVDAGGLHASLDFGAIRNGSWSLQNTGTDDLTLRHTPAAARNSQTAASPTPIEGGNASIPAFLRHYIPTQTEISGFDVHRFFFEHGRAATAWKIAGTTLHLGAWSSGKKSVPAKMDGGMLQTPIQAPQQKGPLKFDIAQATLRVSDEQLQLSDATLRWKQQSEATLRGSLKFKTGAWQTFAHVKAVPLDEFLDAWWKQRLSGKIEGDFEMSGGNSGASAWKAEVALKGGVLMALPILDKLATYTKAARFKRLVLDICQASLHPQGDILHIDHIIVQSNDLLRIEGAMTIRGRAVSGDFMLGVTPETLRSIPGADRRVFVETNSNGPPGLQWTRVQITGTLDAPQEDLSARLIGAVGLSLLFDTPGNVVGKGAEILLKPALGEDAAKVPGKVINGASGLIEQGVKTGTGILNKVLPIFPGK